MKRIQYLITFILILSSSLNGMKPEDDAVLHMLAGKHQAKLVQLLLKQGANANRQGRYHDTPLHRMAYHFEKDLTITERNNIISTVRNLINYGANPYIRNYGPHGELTVPELAKKRAGTPITTDSNRKRARIDDE